MALDGKDIRSYDGDDDPYFQAFVTEMELKDKVKRGRTEEQPALKKLQRFSKQKQWRQQVKRTQQYLGLSTTRTPAAGSMETVCSDLEGLTVTPRVFEEDSGRPIHGDVKPLPCDSDTFVILISVDVEAFEFNQKHITEIGISTLDYNLEPKGTTGLQKYNLVTSVSESTVTSSTKSTSQVAQTNLTLAKANEFTNGM